MFVSTELKKKMYLCMYMLLTICLYFTSGRIRSSFLTAICIVVLSIGACVSFKNRYKDNTVCRLMLLGLCLYASFASFGYRLFLREAFIHVDVVRIVYLILGAIWFYPVLELCVALIGRLHRKIICAERPTPKNSSVRKMEIILWAISFFAQVFIVYEGFYPGFFPVDALEQYLQAKGSYPLNDWHPVLHTLMNRVLLTIWDNPFFLVVAQSCAFAALLSAVLLLGYQRGMSGKVLAAIALVFSILPNQIMSVASPLKDFPYTLALLWGTLCLFKIANQSAWRASAWQILELTACLFLICNLRHNGIMPYAVIVLFLLLCSMRHWKQIKGRLLVVCVASAVLIGGYKGPACDMLHVIPNAVSPYVTMFCAVGSCVNKGKELSDETTKKLVDVMPLEAWAKYYNRFLGHDLYITAPEAGVSMDLTGFSAAEAFGIYFEALAKYPDVVLKDRLDGMNILWDVTQPEESYNFRYFDFISESNDVDFFTQYGICPNGWTKIGNVYQRSSMLGDFYRKLSVPFENVSAQNRSIWDMIIWRSGVYLILFGAMVLYWTDHKLYRILPASIPFIGNTLGMILVLYHQSFRYVYYVQVLVLALLWLTITMEMPDSKKRIALTEEDVE